MLITEQEAEKKRCARELVNTCLASECMAWRWGAPLIERSETEKPAADGWRPVQYFDHARGAEARRWERETAKRGFCGLAGVPKP